MERRFGTTTRRIATGVVALAALGAAGGTAMATLPNEGSGSGSGTAKAAGGKANSVRVMTWNTCANTDPSKSKLCPNGRNTNKVASGIKWHMNRTKNLNAVFLQETCSADVDKLAKLDGLEGWHWKFSPVKDKGSGSSKGRTLTSRACSGSGRGYFGEAVGVKADGAKFTEHRYATKNVPNARDVWGHWNVQESAVCADALGTRFCSTHLTPWKGGHKWSDDKASEFLTSQNGEAKELAGLAKGQKQVVMGGDLNSAPKDSFTYDDKKVSMLDPLYNGYKECSQDAAGGERTGTGTFQSVGKNGKVKRGKKLDYLFANKSAKSSCPVSKKPVTLSDHVPVTAEITF